MENIARDFRGDDNTITDKGLIEEWLDEYTDDETTSLYDYANARGAAISVKEEYV